MVLTRRTIFRTTTQRRSVTIEQTQPYYRQITAMTTEITWYVFILPKSFYGPLTFKINYLWPIDHHDALRIDCRSIGLKRLTIHRGFEDYVFMQLLRHITSAVCTVNCIHFTTSNRYCSYYQESLVSHGFFTVTDP